MTLLSKGLGTYGAFVRLLTRMRADMDSQMGCVVCAVGAVVALNPLRVVAMLLLVVLSQRPLRFEAFAAAKAHMWGETSASGVFGLLVFGQVTL